MLILRFPNGKRKALTFSYDDGVEQDAKLIQILNDHHLKATFNLNSGLFAAPGTTFPPGTIHRRLSLDAALDLYGNSGHEVAVHCLTHASLPELSPEQIVYEVMQDRLRLEKSFQRIIRGMAYPYGTFDDRTASVLQSCGICYARTVVSTHSFDIPRDWMRLPATCHHDDPRLMELAETFLSSPASFGSQLFYLWGHAYEFEAHHNWDVISRFADKTAGHEGIWYATNMEICSYVNGWHHVFASADGSILHNPTSQTFWFEKDSVPQVILPGQTLSL